MADKELVSIHNFSFHVLMKNFPTVAQKITFCDKIKFFGAFGLFSSKAWLFNCLYLNFQKD